MARKHVVRELSDEEFQFVIDRILNGDNDREISLAFQQTFNKKLAKSSLARWRESAGNELAERYRLARYQARQLMSNLKDEGEDKYQVVIRNIEDRLLTATREVIAQDPVKLLSIRQEEEKRRLKERELTIKERALDLEIEKARGTKLDVEALPGQVIEYLLEFIGSDSLGLNWFTKNAKKLEAYLIEKMNASAQS